VTVGKRSRNSAAAPKGQPVFELLLAAARLRFRIWGWQEDQLLLTGPTKLVYVIDTDVMSGYLDPRQMPNHGEVFGSEAISERQTSAENASEALSWTLDRHILLGNGGTEAVERVVPPPLDAEYHRVVHAIRLSAANLRVNRAGLATFNIDEFPNDSAQDLASRYLKSLRGEYSAPSQLARFAALVNDGHLKALQAVLSPEEMNAWTQCGEGPHFDRHYSEWYDLRKEKAGHSLSTATDAELLARLEFFNERYVGKVRLVLVSYTAQYHEWVEDSWATFDEQHPHLFLRHPHSFLEDAKVIAPEIFRAERASLGDTTSNGLSQLLDSFLARFVRGEKASVALLIKRLTALDSQDRKFLGESVGLLESQLVGSLRDGWRSAVAASVVQHASALRADVERDASDTKDASNTQRLMERVFEYSNPLGLNMLMGGLFFNRPPTSLQDLTRPRFPARVVPLLRFSSHAMAQDACMRAARWLADDVQRDRHLEEIRQMRKTLDKEYPDEYSFLLACGLAFGMLGNWNSTHVAAGLAYCLALQQQAGENPNRKESGREASYLAAVALRYASRQRSNLDLCHQWLARFENTLEVEAKLSPPLKGAGESAIHRWRLEAERDACEIAEAMWDHYASAMSQVPPTRHFDELLPKLEQRARLFPSLPADTNGQAWHASIRLQTLINWGLIALFSRVESGSYNAFLGYDEWDELVRSSAAKATPDWSYFMRLIHGALGLLAARSSLKDRHVVLELLEPAAIEDYSVMPYDPARFAMLRRWLVQMPASPSGSAPR